MNKPKLIILEGHDRVGKDALLDSIKSNDSNVYVYKQLTHEETNTDCRDKESYENWLKNYIRNQIDELKELSKEHKIIVMTRLYVTDNVFSDLFKRDHIVEQNFKDELYEFFDIINFCMLWDDYDEYIKRCYQYEDKVEYSKDEFEKIKSLYLKYINDQDPIIYIVNDITREEVYNFFKTCIVYGME